MHEILHNEDLLNVLKSTVNEDDDAPPDNFTGTWEVYWGNGLLHSRSMYVNGVQYGLHLCFWEDGKLAQAGFVWNDKSHGPWVDFHPNGVKSLEGIVGPNGRIGRWTFYDKSGIPKVRKYVDGDEVEIE